MENNTLQVKISAQPEVLLTREIPTQPEDPSTPAIPQHVVRARPRLKLEIPVNSENGLQQSSAHSVPSICANCSRPYSLCTNCTEPDSAQNYSTMYDRDTRQNPLEMLFLPENGG